MNIGIGAAMTPQTSGPRTTANSQNEGRLMVAGSMKEKKKRVLKKLIKSNK